ncbi:aspartyl-phosphate phosphatase Spo0E family protein [Ectobacillus ponti]|uniref:Aspartyl-phosphate phosphatase Spo0E family protein n=1 Tax=Ectobacillus ponti TaxID=2961894 RepID=A0AA41XAL7_9BACI|nr:aspartyl-phosphate phosphatase Spo0E family protein [Ectobacillus ponti]MCP8968521.1 aspartyl-phosphate phosphatase Spo0E family protein [Ectobacillus ponti]
MFQSKRKHMVDKLLLDIKQKREEMIQIGMQNGLASAETIQASQELDLLIVEYQRCKEATDQPFYSHALRRYSSWRRTRRFLTKAVLAVVAASMIG